MKKIKCSNSLILAKMVTKPLIFAAVWHCGILKKMQEHGLIAAIKNARLKVGSEHETVKDR